MKKKEYDPNRSPWRKDSYKARSIKAEETKKLNRLAKQDVPRFLKSLLSDQPISEEDIAKFDTPSKMMVWFEAFEKCHGITRMATKLSGIPQKEVTFWREHYNDFNIIENQILDSAIQEVESKLWEKIDDGNISAILFYLKTIGKHKGYTMNPNLVITNTNKNNTIDSENTTFTWNIEEDEDEGKK